jgi:hypothetical protein
MRFIMRYFASGRSCVGFLMTMMPSEGMGEKRKGFVKRDALKKVNNFA